MPNKLPLLFAAVLLGASACGHTSSATPGSIAPSSGGGSQEGAPLAADARSAATGDIPDTQNFLTLAAARLGVSMLYPEGWTVNESARGVSITDKNNLVQISLSRGPAPTPARVQAQLAALKRSAPTLAAGTARTKRLNSGAAVTVTYRTKSPPNPVTGKQVTLVVDRYVLWNTGRLAIVDLGTPVGVDNVDAYRRMIESFKWR